MYFLLNLDHSISQGQVEPTVTSLINLMFIIDINYYLKQFWLQAKTKDRIKLLKKYANVSVSNKNLLTIRRKQHKLKNSIKRKYCFICKEKPYERHHIIQLQNGGNNVRRNKVALCVECHNKIHPWLKQIRIKNANKYCLAESC